MQKERNTFQHRQPVQIQCDIVKFKGHSRKQIDKVCRIKWLNARFVDELDNLFQVTTER